jgi:hypothetical protein
LSWQPVESRGTMLARVELARSFEEWFSERAPWLLVSVRLQAGVSILCHAHASIESLKPVTVHVCVCKDASGSGVLVAMPESAAKERFETLDAALRWPVAENSGEQSV